MSTELAPQRPFEITGAVAQLPRREAGIIALTAATAGLLAVSGAWAAQPELALAAAIGLGVVGAAPRRAWAAPLTAAAALGGAVLAGMLDVSPVLGAAAVVGLAAARLVPEPTDALDHVNAMLASVAGASMALWGADQLIPLGATAWGAVVGATVVGLGTGAALVPLAIRFDAENVPTIRQIQKALELPYRAPVVQALDLWTNARKHTNDRVTRKGLAEVVTWVFRLQQQRQTLDQEQAAIDPTKIGVRIAAAETAPGGDDAFTKDRRLATIGHLQRLLAHGTAIGIEKTRTEALVDYAIAFLEEARAGLAISRQLPGEAHPDRLPEVLGRLRAHAADGDARRRTMHELKQL